MLGSVHNITLGLGMPKIKRQAADSDTADKGVISWIRDLLASLKYIDNQELVTLGLLILGSVMIVATSLRDDFNPGRDKLEPFVGVVSQISVSQKRQWPAGTWEYDSTDYILKAKDGSTRTFAVHRYLRFPHSEEDLAIGKTVRLEIDRNTDQIFVVETADGRILLDYDTAHAAYNRGLKEWTALYVGIFFATIGFVGVIGRCRQRVADVRWSRKMRKQNPSGGALLS